MEKDDAQLVAAYLDGDEESLSVIVERYLTPIYNFVYRLVGNKEEAQDITQETFLKAWKNLKKYDPTYSFKTWLYTIGRNTTIDHQRKKKSYVFSDFEIADGSNPLSEGLEDVGPKADVVLDRIIDGLYLESLLLKLPPLYREVLLLHYKEGMTFVEIGEILKKPVNTVKSQHHRALAELRRIVRSGAPKE